MSLEHNDKITWVEIKKLKPHPKNPNKHSKEQIERLAEIINYQGFRSPIVVSNRSGLIVAGHGRVEAAVKNNLTKVPVSYQDFTDDEQEYAHMTADNAIADWATLDLSMINKDIIELGPDFNIDMLGIKDFALDPGDKYEDKDADAVPDKVEAKAKLGQIYKLGEHRLMCGDSTDLATVEKLMAGDKADMVFTDPPYNVGYEGKTKDKLTISNDSMEAGDFKEFLSGVFGSIVSATSPGSAVYMSCPLEDGAFLSSWLESGIKLQSILIWLKNSIVMGRKDYHYKHEPILYGWVEGEAHRWYGDRDKSTVIECNKPPRNGEHPTMKPIELVEFFLGNSSKLADAVLDLFGGSGSTLIACEKTNRKCFMMELDPHYVDVIISRWEQFTGKKAELIDG